MLKTLILSLFKQLKQQKISIYADQYQVFVLRKAEVFFILFPLSIILLSFFKETQELFNIEHPIHLVFNSLLLIFVILTTWLYKTKGTQNKSFLYFDLITKTILILDMIVLIYISKDPRTAWWMVYFGMILWIGRLGPFHWFYAVLFFVFPIGIGILFLNDPFFKTYSSFHKSFPIFMSLVCVGIYVYQSFVQKTEQRIRKKNIQLAEELNEIKIKLERERISQNLHDSLGSCLTGNVLYSEIVRDCIEKDPKKAKELLKKIENLSREALVSMRNSIYPLSEDIPLLDLSTSILERFGPLFQIQKIDFHHHIPKQIDSLIPESKKRYLYHLIAETLTNVLKHSKASRVSLIFSIEKKGNSQNSDSSVSILNIAIQDNGKGLHSDTSLDFSLDPSFLKGGKRGEKKERRPFEIVELEKGYGLQSIQKRVEELSAYLEIHSKPKQGTEFVFRLKLENSKASEPN